METDRKIGNDEAEPIGTPGGFSGIFVAFGAAIFLWGARYGVPAMLGLKAGGGFAVALLALAAMGFFERWRYRLAAIVSAVCFVSTMAGAIFTVLLDQTGDSQTALLAGGVLLSASCLLAYLLVRVPILVAGIPAGAALAAVATVAPGFVAQENTLGLVLAVMVVGLLSLTVAVWLDTRDPQRRGRQHEAAFWAYFAGTPLALHPVMVWTLFGGQGAPTGPDWALVALACTAALLFGLAMDRRGPVVSTTVYITLIVSWAIAGGDWTSAKLVIVSMLPVATMTAGLYIVVVGVAWYPIRSALLRSGLLPAGILARLPRDFHSGRRTLSPGTAGPGTAS